MKSGGTRRPRGDGRPVEKRVCTDTVAMRHGPCQLCGSEPAPSSQLQPDRLFTYTTRPGPRIGLSPNRDVDRQQCCAHDTTEFAATLLEINTRSAKHALKLWLAFYASALSDLRMGGRGTFRDERYEIIRTRGCRVLILRRLREDVHMN